MNIPDTLLPSNLVWAANLLMILVLFISAKRAHWHLIAQPDLQNVFFASIVTLMLIWSIRTGIKPGLNFHMLGATLLTLMFGPYLAIIGLCAVLVLVTAFGHAGIWSLGLNFALMVLLPVLFSQLLYYWVDKKLPNHFFIYVLVNSFFGAAAAMVLCGLSATLLLAISGTYNSHYLYDNYLLYFILMAWSEAFLTGMAITLMVVYRPRWVSTFDDKRYLNR